VYTGSLRGQSGLLSLSILLLFLHIPEKTGFCNLELCENKDGTCDNCVCASNNYDTINLGCVTADSDTTVVSFKTIACLVFLSSTDPMRIRIRIDPPYPLVCGKGRLNGVVLRM
jgi:hypothetical protein